MCLLEHISNFGARYENETRIACLFAEMLNVSADILALAAVWLVGEGEVSSIFYWNQSFGVQNPAFLSRPTFSPIPNSIATQIQQKSKKWSNI